MKKILLGFCCFLPAVAQAFFSTTDEYQVLEQSTVANVEGDFLEVTITEKIQGSLEITPLFALPESAESVHFFVDGAGVSLEKKEGQERLKTIFNEAKRINNPMLFRFGSPTWPLLFSTAPFTISDAEPTITKLKYRIKLDFLDDIFYAELPETKGTVTLVVTRNKKIYHLLPVCDQEGRTTKVDDQIVWQGKCGQSESFRFYFSEVPNPNLVYKTDEATYVAHLLDPDQFQKYHKFHFFVDKSGSSYGTRWEKTKEVLLTILSELSPSDEVKIDFFDKEVKPFNETFVPNTRENQKKLTTYFDTVAPLGKTDATFLSSAYEAEENDTLIFLLGDFQTFSPKDNWWKTNPKNPFVVLSFTDNEILNLWARTTGGFFLKLFESPDFIKRELFWQKFNHTFKPFLAHSIVSKFPTQHEFLPYQHTQYATGISNFFISRSFEKNSQVSNTTASFLPRLWGQRKIGSFLRKELRGETLTDAEKEAVSSITRVFGIKFSLDNGINFEHLNRLESPNLIGRTVALSRGELLDHVPFYDEGTHRFVYNFPTTQNQFSIAPFSEAQKELLLQFSDIFSRPFSLMPRGGSLSFCYKDWRCLTIKGSGQKEARESDKLYWRGRYINHWANEYIQQLAEKNIYKLTDDGNPLPDNPITRAEFVKMAVEYRYGRDFERVSEGRVFQDITDKYLGEVVAFLVEKGVIRGYGDNTFRPSRTLSRAEGVKILLAMNGKKQPEDYQKPATLPFPDIGGWETFWVILAKETGMVKGYENGNFGPHDPLTRGQSAKLIVENFK